ncbi:MAG: cytochrome c-type biogenesis protein CcmH/NrfG [Sphingomonas echinoides]|jgi:cytochrome c-type biogenesis protein CcmH/NrfG
MNPMTKMIALSLLVLAPLSAPAVANPTAATPSASAAAQNADAITTLETRVRLNPDDGGRHIELAAAYLRSGRTAEALTAFRRARALDNEMLETPTGDAIWSHQIADRVLARAAARPVQLSSR